MEKQTTNSTNHRPPPGARVLIAMSGGVDSVAAAVLLTRAGYRCMGATLRLTAESPDQPVFEPCCGLQAAEDARSMCERLGIEHRTIRVVEAFDQHIITPFAKEYREGRTPNPCIQCNRLIKFGLLFREARKWGCEYVAMGHYARLRMHAGRLALLRGVDRHKDQSYVLAPLTQAQLLRSCFPLGEMTKEEARAVATEIDPTIGAKAESQEICFVTDRNYARIVEERYGPGAPGNIVDVKGNVLGRHAGIYRYTIGQRRGLGISAEVPLYVLRIDVENNAVVVGRDEESLCATFSAGRLFWGARPPGPTPFKALVQLRYKHIPAPGTVSPEGKDTQVFLDVPQRAVTPGQWAVFYDDQDFVLGAAVIRTFANC